jgi:ArsR family transcriptional regulator
MKKLVKVLKATSDPNRLRILKVLQIKSMCVCELQFTLELAQSSISKHMKILEEADLVESQKDGLWVNYFLHKSNENDYAAEMLEKLESWLKDDPELEKIIEKARRADRIEIKSL